MSADDRFTVGDVIPMQHAEKTDTFFMVTINGEKYLVDKDGKVVLKQGGKEEPASSTPATAPAPAPAASPPPTDPGVKLIYKPGSPEFNTAVEHVKAIVRQFMERLHRDYRQLAPRMIEALKKNQTPFIKFLDRRHGERPALLAYLIREFFTRTTVDERGLEILEFLTWVIAVHEDGSFGRDRVLPPDKQRAMITDFLVFLRELGDTPEKQKLMALTHKAFIDQEFNLFQKEGGAGFYINSSISKALKSQRDFLLNDSNRNYIESQYRKRQRVPGDLCQDNMLSYLKALAILRLISNSKKEQRGRNDDERELLLYDILAFRPDWQPLA
jgi:hypothetical protein